MAELVLNSKSPILHRHVLLLLWVFAALSGFSANLEKYKASALKWESAIREFEQRDRTEVHPEDALLFVGSSSIRLWSTIQQDMAPYPVIQRGYGGAKLSDVAWYAQRIIYPHKFKALILFVGNDISGTKEDKTPAEVADLFLHIVNTVREKYADTPVFLLGITPTIKRWPAWPKIRQANQVLKAVCDKTPRVHFIETASRFLDADGRPKEALFAKDKLHLNRDGYTVWSRIIKRRLEAALP